MKHLSMIACALLIGLGTIAAAPEPTRTQDQVEILSAVFGLFDASTPGRVDFKPADVVPLKPQQNYGWIIQLRTEKPSVHYREEFTLPATAKNWNTQGASDVTVSADRRTAITERVVEPKNGVILNVWSVAPDDPPGHYVIRVTVEGQLRQFDFDVR